MAVKDLVELRFAFVELLFALTVAEIAVQFGTLAASHKTLIDAPTAYAHLLLALVLVGASWVGWSTSKAPGNEAPVTGVFTFPFLVLLVDVALVVFYFIIVKGVELVSDAKGISIVPSAEKEAFWFMMVFLVYLGWDVLTKILVSPAEGRKDYRFRVTSIFWPRAKVSLLCAVVAVIIWFALKEAKTTAGILAADAALLALTLLFRAMKEWQRDKQAQTRRWSFGLTALGIVAFAAGVVYG